MAQAIRVVECRGFDVMLQTDRKIQLEAYSHNCLGYDVTCSASRLSVSGRSQDGVGLVTRERPVGWGIESMRYHILNVVSCKIVTGLTCTPLVGAYLYLSTLKHLPDLEENLQRFRDPIFLSDMNVDLGEERSLRSQLVADLLA